MTGMNRNSRTGKREPLVREETKAKAEKARRLRDKGFTFKEIGEHLGISSGRAWELCQEPDEPQS